VKLHVPLNLPPKPLRCLALATGLLCLALMSGCDSLAALQRSHKPEVPISRDDAAAVLLARQVDAQQRLIQGTAAEQHELLESLRSAYEQSRAPAAGLHYALALALPGHPAHDPALARRLLQDSLAEPERLAPVERSLALLQLQCTDLELRLTEENQRLNEELQRDHAKERAAAAAVASKRLQAEIDENAKLRRALDEAKAKLDAIATIEQHTP
jgi:hypothetical protein